jgi:hypothetical protein
MRIRSVRWSSVRSRSRTVQALSERNCLCLLDLRYHRTKVLVHGLSLHQSEAKPYSSPRTTYVTSYPSVSRVLSPLKDSRRHSQDHRAPRWISVLIPWRASVHVQMAFYTRHVRCNGSLTGSSSGQQPFCFARHFCSLGLDSPAGLSVAASDASASCMATAKPNVPGRLSIHD